MARRAAARRSRQCLDPLDRVERMLRTEGTSPETPGSLPDGDSTWRCQTSASALARTGYARGQVAVSPAGSQQTGPSGAGAPTRMASSGRVTPPRGLCRPGSAPTPTGRGIRRRGQTCGVRTDGSLWCWGYNEQGQLGLGDTSNLLVPTRVGTDTDWGPITGGGVAHVRRPNGPDPVVLGKQRGLRGLVWVTPPIDMSPPRSSARATGIGSWEEALIPARSAPTGLSGAGATTSTGNSGWVTGPCGWYQPGSTPTPTGRGSCARKAATRAGSVPTSRCGAGASTEMDSSGWVTRWGSYDPSPTPGRHRHRLGADHRRGVAHVRDPCRRVAVVLGRQLPGPTRVGCHRQSAVPYPGLGLHR